MDDIKKTEENLKNKSTGQDSKNHDSSITANTVEEYDYTSQNLLLASLREPDILTAKPLTKRVEDTNEATEAKQMPQQINHTSYRQRKIAVWFFGIIIAALCFLFSYGFLSYLHRQADIFLWLREFGNRSFFLILLTISLVSLLLTLFLPVLLYGIKTLFCQIRLGFSSFRSSQRSQTEYKGTKEMPVFSASPPKSKGEPIEEEPAENIEFKPMLKSYETEYRSQRFYFSMQFLLRKKWIYFFQSFIIGLLSVFCASGTFFSIDLFPIAILFAVVILIFSAFFLLLIRNQYMQGLENLFQSMVQQIYQNFSPTNSYNQLNAVNMLYALAFVEAVAFQERVTVEFQSILKLTRSSWYQTKYSNSPSILVEEALRRLLSAINFRQLLFGETNVGKASFLLLRRHFLRDWCYHFLFLKYFQSFQSFRDHATVSLLSHMGKARKQNRMPRAGVHFVLENYYLVGINLSKLRIKEAHFQNCQLSHSTWANSELIDCSISSCRFDQVILYRSDWRRFLWTANTAREIDVEYCSFLQGNFKYCNLQGIQSGNHWKMQHCFLQECSLNHSTFCIDNWSNIKASNCNWHGVLLSFKEQLYSMETDNLIEILKGRLEIKS